jgi:hypothetical protein
MKCQEIPADIVITHYALQTQLNINMLCGEYQGVGLPNYRQALRTKWNDNALYTRLCQQCKKNVNENDNKCE